MRIPSLKKIEVADLNLIFVGSIRKWANAQHETVHLDLATAAADELESRGRPVPFDEVRAETQLMFATAIIGAEEIQARFAK